MYVTVEIDNQEYEMHFQQDPVLNGNGTSWSSYLNEGTIEAAFVRFHEKDGLVYNLDSSSNVTINKTVLGERIASALIQFREEQFAEIESEDEKTISIDPVPYDPEKIKVRRDIYSVRHIFEMIEDDKAIDLNPEFQRYFVWDKTQQSQLIESLLLGLPIPLFYFAENNDRSFTVVDGLQRLTTLHNFMRNEFALKGLEYLGRECNGLYFKLDLEKGITAEKILIRPMSRRIEQTQLVVNVIEASSPAQAKFDIFKRINTGGKHLNNQEIRNFVATPSTRKMLHNMVHTELFREVTGGSDLAKRMDDQELALRFIGFKLVRQGYIEYNGNMNSFLNAIVDFLNGMKEWDLKHWVNSFEIALKNCQYLFGEYAFRKCLPQHLEAGARRQLINKSLFTTWTVVLSERDVRRDIKPGSFAYIQAEELASKNEFYENVTNRTNDRTIIEKVFEIVASIASNHLPKLQPA